MREGESVSTDPDFVLLTALHRPIYTITISQAAQLLHHSKGRVRRRLLCLEAKGHMKRTIIMRPAVPEPENHLALFAGAGDHRAILSYAAHQGRRRSDYALMNETVFFVEHPPRKVGGLHSYICTCIYFYYLESYP